jgi:hypothetical protein
MRFIDVFELETVRFLSATKGLRSFNKHDHNRQMQRVNLVCLLDGNSLMHCFQVLVDCVQTINNLKDLIRVKRQYSLRNFCQVGAQV